MINWKSKTSNVGFHKSAKWLKPKLVESVQVMFLSISGASLMFWQIRKWGTKKRPEILSFKVDQLKVKNIKCWVLKISKVTEAKINRASPSDIFINLWCKKKRPEILSFKVDHLKVKASNVEFKKSGKRLKPKMLEPV